MQKNKLLPITTASVLGDVTCLAVLGDLTFLAVLGDFTCFAVVGDFTCLAVEKNLIIQAVSFLKFGKLTYCMHLIMFSPLSFTIAFQCLLFGDFLYHIAVTYFCIKNKCSLLKFP